VLPLLRRPTRQGPLCSIGGQSRPATCPNPPALDGHATESSGAQDSPPDGQPRWRRPTSSTSASANQRVHAGKVEGPGHWIAASKRRREPRRAEQWLTRTKASGSTALRQRSIEAVTAAIKVADRLRADMLHRRRSAAPLRSPPAQTPQLGPRPKHPRKPRSDGNRL